MFLFQGTQLLFFFTLFNVSVTFVNSVKERKEISDPPHTADNKITRERGEQYQSENFSASAPFVFHSSMILRKRVGRRVRDT